MAELSADDIRKFSGGGGRNLSAEDVRRISDEMNASSSMSPGIASRASKSVRDYAKAIYEDPMGFLKQLGFHTPEGMAQGADALATLVSQTAPGMPVLRGTGVVSSTVDVVRKPVEEAMRQVSGYRGEGEFETAGQRAGAGTGEVVGMNLPFAGGAYAAGARSLPSVALEAAGVLGAGAGSEIGRGAAPAGATPEQEAAYRAGGEIAGLLPAAGGGLVADILKAGARRAGYGGTALAEKKAGEVMQANVSNREKVLRGMRESQETLGESAMLTPGQAGADSGLLTQEAMIARRDPKLQGRLEEMAEGAESSIDQLIRSEIAPAGTEPADVSARMAKLREESRKGAKKTGSTYYNENRDLWESITVNTENLKADIQQRLGKFGEAYFETAGIGKPKAIEQLLDLPDNVSAQTLIDRRRGIRRLKESKTQDVDVAVLDQADKAIKKTLYDNNVPFIREADDFWSQMKKTVDNKELNRVVEKRASDLGKRYFKPGRGAGSLEGLQAFKREIAFMRRAGQDALADDRIRQAQEYLVSSAYKTGLKDGVPHSRPLRQWMSDYGYLRDDFPEAFQQIDRAETLAKIGERARLRPQRATIAQKEPGKFASQTAEKVHEAMTGDFGTMSIPVAGARKTLEFVFTTIKPKVVDEMLKRAVTDPEYAIRLLTIDTRMGPNVLRRTLSRLPKGASAQVVEKALLSQGETQ